MQRPAGYPAGLSNLDRKLTVYNGRGAFKKSPLQILLQGNRLEQVGFSAGDKITVKCQPAKGMMENFKLSGLKKWNLILMKQKSLFSEKAANCTRKLDSNAGWPDVGLAIDGYELSCLKIWEDIRNNLTTSMEAIHSFLNSLDYIQKILYPGHYSGYFFDFENYVMHLISSGEIKKVCMVINL